MNHGMRDYRTSVSVTLALAIFSVGCASADDWEPKDVAQSAGADENLGSVQQDFEESDCAENVPPDARIVLGQTSYTSTRTYSHPYCYKAVVVDFAANLDYSTEFRWADDLPGNSSDCADAWLAANLYYWNSSEGEWSMYNPTRESRGVWSGGRCRISSLRFEGATALVDYRITGTARTNKSSGAATRKVRAGWRRRLSF